jgi:DNA-binding transcriptional MerR regulator
MIKIGVFSQLAQVSIRTLRHYDVMGLFKPEFIEPITNYRYYGLEQLPRLTRILALKEMGLTLEQIIQMVNKDLSNTQLREMLNTKQKELADQMEQSQLQMERIKVRLWQIEQEGKPSAYEVILKKVPTYNLVSIRKIIPTIQEMVAYRCRMYKDLYQWLVEHHIKVDQELALYHFQEFIESNFDFEAAVAISRDDYERTIKCSKDNIAIYLLPEEDLVASVIHSGAFMQVSQALFDLFKWISLHNYSPTGPIREIHLFGHENDLVDPNSIVVELQIPVMKNK